jgi:type IV pilus assembly protein PilN
MIRINLLSAERHPVKKAALLQLGQKLTVACSLILIAAALVIGWRFWALRQESSRLDAEIAAAQGEATRLHSIIGQVQEFEQRRTQLQQRVALIEQLRKDQIGPVHMLDQISRALPPMTWLLSLKQDAEAPAIVSIDGLSTTLTGLSDFVANLEAAGYFKRSVEIVSSVAEAAPRERGEVIRFAIRAEFQGASAGSSATASATPGQARRPKGLAGTPR